MHERLDDSSGDETLALRSGKPIGLLGIALIAIVTSIATTLATLAATTSLFGNGESALVAQLTTAASTSPEAQRIECGDQVYSPVQNTCVDQAVFDDEMQRLFKALGMDPSIYQGK